MKPNNCNVFQMFVQFVTKFRIFSGEKKSIMNADNKFVLLFYYYRFCETNIHFSRSLSLP